MHRRTIICRGLVLLLLAAQASCGFQLRSSADLPPVMERTYLNIPPVGNDELIRELRRNLSTDKISIVDDPKQATATLNVLSANRYDRVLTVSNTGRPLEKEIAYQIEFSLTTPSKILITPQTLLQTRNFAYDETAPLANGEESDQLYNSMQRDMAQLILFRIKAVSAQAAATTKK